MSTDEFVVPPLPRPTRTTYKDPVDKHAPKHVRLQEAERMGRIDTSTVPARQPTVVPSTPAEFIHARRAYKQQMKAFRKQYMKEWGGRRQREAEAMQAYRAKLDEAKALRAEAKVQQRLAKRVEHVERLRLQFHEKRLRKELSRAARAAFVAELAKKRQAWLEKVDTEAAEWIPEDKVEDVINDDLWTMQHPWQYQEWYAYQERKQLSVRSGDGFLAEGDSDDEYWEEWTSDVEDEDEWAPLYTKQSTGLQLQELYAGKRTPELVEDFKKWKDAYVEQHYPEADWEFLKGDDGELEAAGGGEDDVDGGDDVAAADSNDADDDDSVSIDEIIDMLAAETSDGGNDAKRRK